MFLREQKSKLTNLRFLYSQDLSNCTTLYLLWKSKTPFLYSQDLSNCTTSVLMQVMTTAFLYSQDLSNCTTQGSLVGLITTVFVLSRFK